MLSSLWGGIKNIASSVAGGISNAASAILGTGNSGSGAMQFPLAPNINPSTLSPYNQTIAPNMTVAPTSASPGGAGKDNVAFNSVAYQASQNQAVSNIRPSTATGSSGSGGKTNQNWTPPVDSLGRTSNKNQGTPYYDASGKYIVPKTGFEGVSGQGGGGFSVINPVGQQGAAGADVSRGFGGAGQGTASSLMGTPTSDEETRKSSDKGSTQTISQNPTAQAYNMIGAQGQQAPLQTPPVPETIDAGWISGVQETLSKTLSSNMSEQDKQAVYAQLQTNLLNAKTKLDQSQPIPETPVVDTAEQMAFYEQSADPFGVKNAIDQFREEQTNLAELQTSRVELMKSVQALNEAYRPIVDEIKQNPNMPKALARRKIEALAFTQKETMQGFLDQLQIINQQVDDQNEIVNRAFDIVSYTENKANRAQDNLRQNLNMMMSSGAIGGFTDAELKQYADALGVSVSGLKKARDAALEPELDIITNEFADGSLRGIDKNTGKVVWSTPGAAKVTGSGSDSGKQLSVSDIKSLNELYESSGIKFQYGDTDVSASQKIQATQESANVMSELQSDIQNGFTNLQELKRAYPELSGSQILAALNQTNPQNTGSTSTIANIPGAIKDKASSFASQLFGR